MLELGIMNLEDGNLREYKRKRDFSKTSEPEGETKKSKSKALIFVIQSHFARNLHYDFRLEHDGGLKSWAVPKEPPKEKGVKRLAMQVEDHPLEYGNFHGVIPEGYGKGTVKIWDNGTYQLKSWDSKKIELSLQGKKLNGNYVLIKTHFGSSEKSKNKSWLLFKVD